MLRQTLSAVALAAAMGTAVPPAHAIPKPPPRTMAAAVAPTITTGQHRMLNGVAGHNWGPVFLKAAGGSPPYTWTLAGGALPSGVTLSSAGRLEGRTPTAGTFTFTVRVTDAFNTSSTKTYTITVAATYTPPASLATVPRPFGYIQSAFFLGGCTDPNSYLCDPADPARNRAMIRGYFKRFDGGEVYFNSLETASDFLRVRQYHADVQAVRTEPNGREFIGVYGGGRFPDFFFPEDINAQPASYRAQALKSNGALWTRRPESRESITSVFATHAEHVDITNETAVRTLTDSLAAAYDHEGPTTSSIGPMYGFFVLNEAKATTLYHPFAVLDSVSPDNEDLVPATGGTLRPACTPGWNERRTNPPLLYGGVDPCVLYSDPDIRFSYLFGPKRSIALFSLAARDKFVAYAAARGVSVSTLPADRAEFNDTGVSLPAHVSFVPLSNTAVWNVWRDWVYDTWHDYVDRVVRTVTFAQAGNAGFRGTIYFQLPGWATFRAPIKDEEIVYSYTDASEVRRTTSGKLGSFARYDELDAFVAATDVEKMMANPWITAWLHETTTPMVGEGGGAPTRAGDLPILTSPTGIWEWNHQTAAVQLLASYYKKRWGLFARYYYFGGGNVQLSVPDWEWNWDRHVPLFRPDMMSTLPGSYYLSQSDIEPAYAHIFGGQVGAFGPSWTARMDRLRCALQLGATNPSPTDYAWRTTNTPTLSWSPGSGVTSYQVYLGTSPGSMTLRSTQGGTSYSPGTLSSGTTYYWRVDAVGACGTSPGIVWQFTTIPARWSIFTTQLPQTTGAAAPGWEVATRFTTSRAGKVVGFRFWKAVGESGTHTARLWSDTGTPLGQATFQSESASGWQTVMLADLGLADIPLAVGTPYRVSVNTMVQQVKTNGGLMNGPIVNGPLTADNSYYGQPTGAMPNSGSLSTFFVDVIFEEDVVGGRRRSVRS